MRNPAFIDINDSFTLLVDFKHLLSIQTPQNFVSFQVSSERNSPDFLVREIELSLKYTSDYIRGDYAVRFFLYEVLNLLDRPD